jgi:hypothetical protein
MRLSLAQDNVQLLISLEDRICLANDIPIPRRLAQKGIASIVLPGLSTIELVTMNCASVWLHMAAASCLGIAPRRCTSK